MNPILPVRSLMQVKEGSNEDEKFRNLLIGGGAVLAVMMVFFIFASVYACQRHCRHNSQNRKYSNWTEAEGVLEEFHSPEVSHRNPLLVAIEVKNVPLVRELVGKGTQSCTYIDRAGNYALLAAAGTRSQSMVKYIAEHTPSDFRPHGRSPLHEAAYHEDLEILSFLIQKFPDLQRNRDGGGNSYLQELCVEWTGSNVPQPRLKQGKKYLQFIDIHRKFIPTDLFKGTLEPYRDLKDEEITIKMASIDSDSEALL
jgi:hypothetical protein